MTKPTRVLPLIVAGMVIFGVACGDDGESSTTTTEATTTTAVADTTTSTSSVPTTSTLSTTAVPPTSDPGDDALPTDPQAYATAFVGAWEAGDQDSALVFGTQDAVDTIFAYDSGGPGSWSVTQCEGAAGSSYCTFTAGGDGTIVVRVGNEAASQGQQQAVTEVQVNG